MSAHPGENGAPEIYSVNIVPMNKILLRVRTPQTERNIKPRISGGMIRQAPTRRSPLDAC
jgi:hypothetical protein